jgi:hypothetical protein
VKFGGNKEMIMSHKQGEVLAFNDFPQIFESISSNFSHKATHRTFNS